MDEFAGMADEVTVNFRGQTLTVVSALRGARAEDVLGFTRFVHERRFRRADVLARLALPCERPEAWVVNPKPGRLGELWCVIVDWGEVDLAFGGE